MDSLKNVDVLNVVTGQDMISELNIHRQHQKLPINVLLLFSSQSS
jgi:hypothetical protein